MTSKHNHCHRKTPLQRNHNNAKNSKTGHVKDNGKHKGLNNKATVEFTKETNPTDMPKRLLPISKDFLKNMFSTQKLEKYDQLDPKNSPSSLNVCDVDKAGTISFLSEKGSIHAGCRNGISNERRTLSGIN